MNFGWFLAIVITVIAAMALLMWLQTRVMSRGFGSFIARIVHKRSKTKGEGFDKDTSRLC